MNSFKTRSGIVMVEIQGEYLLVADKEARKSCRYILPANETMAFYWELLEKGYTEKQLLQAAIEDFDAPEEVLRVDLHQLLEGLVQLGYLIRKD